MRMTLCTGTLIVLTSASTAFAAPFQLRTDRVAYTGDVTVFDTLTDAMSGVNARSGPHTIPTRNAAAPLDTSSRDASFFFSDGISGQDDANVFLTAWFYTTNDTQDTLGWGNPNNTNTGFFQLFDDNGSTDTSVSGAFQNFDGSVFTEFRLQAALENAGSDDVARLWHAPNTGGQAGLTAGEFLSFNLDVTFGGLMGSEDSGGVITATDHPDSVSGSLTGIFQNTNAIDPSLNGFYVFDLAFNMNSWAFAQDQAGLLNEDFDPNAEFADSFFQEIPTPGALSVFSVFGFAALRRRRG